MTHAHVTTQPLISRLHAGIEARALTNLPLSGLPLGGRPFGQLRAGERVTVTGDTRVHDGKRWWQVSEIGATGPGGLAWTYECDSTRYYLEPANTGTWYEVRSGDSWSKIAAQFHTTVAALKQANPSLVRRGDIIHPGERMWIPE